MSRVKRQKLERSSNAAYAASQPLFDALRNATNTSLPAQTSNLTTARDVVQSLHVKIADTDNTHNDISRHERYMDSAVKAWGSAVDAYCEIFTEMVKITGSEPSEGREEGSRHREFVAILDSAKKAQSVVEEFRKAETTTQTRDEEDESSGIEVATAKNGNGKRAQSSSPPAAKDQHQPQLPRQDPSHKKSVQRVQKPSALNEAIRYDKSGAKILWKDGELKVPYPSLEPDEKRMWDLIKRKMKRKTRATSAKRARATPKAEPSVQANAASTEKQADATPSAQQGGSAEIQFEDVSGEVERRIKAKAEKKAAEKAKSKEKKRKRESADSTIAVEQPAPADEESITVAQKPSKKKAKKEHTSEDSGINVNGASKDAPETPGEPKRKQEAEEEVAVEEGKQTSKKRKKTKS